MYCCNKCDRQFQSISKYKEHTDKRLSPCKRPTHKCNNCSKDYSSYQSLWKHKQRCKGGAPEIPTFDGSEFEPGKPKSKETMDKIRKLVLPRKRELEISKSPSELSLSSPPSLAISELKPKSLGELWCKEGQKEDEDDDEEDEEDEDDDQDQDDDDDQDDDQVQVKFLPTTKEALQERFNELFYEFTRQKKKRNRNELVFLLDEMLRKNFITPLEYQSLNNILAESLGSGVEEMEVEEPNIKDLIKSTVDYLTEDDTEEISRLIKELEAEAGEEKDSVRELARLINRYLDGEPIMTEILEFLPRLESVFLLKPLRIKILLKNIDKIRYRVYTILTRLDDLETEEEIPDILRTLVSAELISPEEEAKLMRDDAAMEINTIADIIKEGKK